MTTTTDLCFLSLQELATRIAAKDVSPVEATEAVLERIERLNPKLNAYITVMAGQALAGARAAADEIAAGKYRGPLHGVPVGVKDLCQTKGVRTTAGSKILADWVPDEDATVVRKLRDAGAVIVGKTHLHEWAFGATGINPHYGPAHNPWNVDCITGGSSSGSAVAVAAGMCFAALGSDTGGSIRIPSALCGVTGIKPTYGRVSTRNVIPLSWSLDHIGPMARTARDCALVLGAIAGHDPEEATSADTPVDDYAAKTEGGLRGLRVGVPAQAFESAEGEVSSIVQEAVATLARLGAKVEHIDLPQLDAMWATAGAVLLSEAATYHKEHIEQRPEDYGEDVIGRLRAGLELKAVDLVQGYRALAEIRRTCDDTLLNGLDLLAQPATQRVAVPIEEAKQDDPTLGLTRLTAQFDVTGQPACSVPCGWTKAGLPVGLQLVGRSFQEGTVLRAAHAFETQSGVPRPQPAVE